MSNHQRGVYQPLMDNVPIYDLSEEEVEEEHSRLPLLIIIALLVLAAFAGVVWLAYNQGVARGRASAAVVIAPPAGPVRTAPADSEATTPYTGLKVYDQPISPDQEAQASNLAPAPRESLPAPAENPPATTETPPARLNPENAKVATAPLAAAPKAAPPAPTVLPPKPAAQVASPAAATAAARAPAKPATEAPAPAHPAVPAVATAQPSSGAASAASGAAVLQIGAYETPEIANGAWNALHKRFSAVVVGLSQDVQKADLGAKGTWYRLRVGPFADKAAAAAACEKLRAQGGTCFVAAP